MEAVFAWLAENFDLPILDWISARLSCPTLDRVMPIITALGNAGFFWILLSVILLLTPRCRKAGASMALALILGLVVCNAVMKPLFARIRPYDYQLLHHGRVVCLLVEAESDFSFPSGHTIASFEAATALCIRDRHSGIPALILACLIAFSRLYLYLHYPTDVLASVVLGIGIAFLASWAVDAGHRICRRHGIL